MYKVHLENFINMTIILVIFNQKNTNLMFGILRNINTSLKTTSFFC